MDRQLILDQPASSLSLSLSLSLSTISCLHREFIWLCLVDRRYGNYRKGGFPTRCYSRTPSGMEPKLLSVGDVQAQITGRRKRRLCSGGGKRNKGRDDRLPGVRHGNNPERHLSGRLCVEKESVSLRLEEDIRSRESWQGERIYGRRRRRGEKYPLLLLLLLLLLL